MKSKTNTILLALILVVLALIAYQLIANRMEHRDDIRRDDEVIKKDDDTTKDQTDTTSAPSVVKTLYKKINGNGLIEECVSSNGKFYATSMNGYDTMSYFYNASGKKIGSGGGFSGNGDGNNSPEFNQADFQNCTRVFVSAPNVWGFPAVNKYNLK
jgi:hypothetical protein